MEGGFLADGPRRRTVVAATRPLYEQLLRRRVAGLDGVELRPGCQFTDYVLDDAGERVSGIVVRSTEDGEAPPEQLAADLVVDATGRTSRTPEWLDDHGYTAPPVEEVRVDVTYSTVYVDRPDGDRRGVAVFPSPGRPRGGVCIPVEDGRWLVTLWGMHGDDPPTDPEGFVEFAASLPVSHLERLLDEHDRLTDDIPHYPFPANLRRRYEELDRFPDGLIVVGDGVASFNPIYGQGMSVAAFEAVQLHHALAADGLDDLTFRYFDRIEETVDLAWNLAVGSDHQFPQTDGPKPRGTDILNWYLSRYLQQAHTDGKLRDDFFRVQMMELPPSALFRPRNLWRVFGPMG